MTNALDIENCEAVRRGNRTRVHHAGLVGCWRQQNHCGLRRCGWAVDFGLCHANSKRLSTWTLGCRPPKFLFYLPWLFIKTTCIYFTVIGKVYKLEWSEKVFCWWWVLLSRRNKAILPGSSVDLPLPKSICFNSGIRALPMPQWIYANAEMYSF